MEALQLSTMSGMSAIRLTAPSSYPGTLSPFQGARKQAAGSPTLVRATAARGRLQEGLNSVVADRGNLGRRNLRSGGAQGLAASNNGLKGLPLAGTAVLNTRRSRLCGCARILTTCQAASSVALEHTTAGFDEMTAGTERKFVMVGGKGGVGKTSLSAALATRFAMDGHNTLIVSTDPAHSLSDSFAQDVSGGSPVQLSGTDLPLWGLEVDPESAKDEFRQMTGRDGESGGVGKGVSDFMGSMGMGALAEQLSDLKLGELLDTPPPGLDEAVAIAKVVQILQTEEYSKFTRIIFDTAPTGHTLRLLSLPDFLEASVGKIVKLRQKISNATQAIKSVFGGAQEQDEAVQKLENLQVRLRTVRDLFRNKETTEFVIVTIPTMMALLESSRLIAELGKEGVPVRRIVINQILPETSADCRFCKLKFKDQHRAMETMNDDPNFRGLRIVESPMFDLEIRGIPALQFLASQVWK